jgi:ligand-binding sensor domain-containing protein
VTGHKGVQGTEVWDLYEDSQGNIWFPAEGYGIYRFDGETYRGFGPADGLGSPAVQCSFEDRQGRVWVGGYMGLYRFDGTLFTNFTNMGPWN